MGKQESGSYEFKMMGPKGFVSGMVQGRSGKRDKDSLKEEEKTSNAWFCSEFGITSRKSLTRRGTRRRTE